MIVGVKVKFRVDHVFERPKVPVFDRYEDEFKLDKEADMLVKVGKIDTQELIESSMDCALTRILDKYMPEQVDKLVNSHVINVEGTHERVNSDLADLGAEYERVEQLKHKYALDESLSYFDTLSKLKDLQLEVGDTIKRLESKNIQHIANIEKKNNNLEVVNNETKNE